MYADQNISVLVLNSILTTSANEKSSFLFQFLNKNSFESIFILIAS